LADADKNAPFKESNIGEAGLDVKKKLTARYCGRNGGIQYGGLSSGGPGYPPGRIKIMDALRSLLEEKEFGAITWAEIGRTASVNEGLIYKYF
jgi:hypothetical protein